MDMEAQGVPVPNAEVFDELLGRYSPDGPILRYLHGNDTDINNTNTDNFDINVLDAQTVTKMIREAEKKIFYKRSRRDHEPKEIDFLGRSDINQYTVYERIFDLMEQSIHFIRFRIRATKKYRDYMRNETGYQIGMMFGVLNRLLLSSDEIQATMWTLPVNTHFLFYLNLYERQLAVHTDVINLVQRIYSLHNKILNESLDRPPDTPAAETTVEPVSKKAG